jgi:hypothetical protein
MCSAVFVSGFDPEFVGATLGDCNALAPVAHFARSSVPMVDRKHSELRGATKSGLTRTARYIGNQGYESIPEGASGSNQGDCRRESFGLFGAADSAQLWTHGHVSCLAFLKAPIVKQTGRGAAGSSQGR